MSRVGNMPITIPSSVNFDVNGQDVKVTGPKGSLSLKLLPKINVKVSDGVATVSPSEVNNQTRAQHGLMRGLIDNMVTGVSEGYTKKLEVNGVGYRVSLSGSDLNLSLGFSHSVTYKVPETVTVNVEQNNITISGIDKQQVGQVAAEIRSLKKPEPYKGKGIKYADERIIRKTGKSGKET